MDDDKTKYSTARIDKTILDTIDEIIKDKRIMYKSRSEFIHSTLREKLESYFILFPDLKTKLQTTSKKK